GGTRHQLERGELRGTRHQEVAAVRRGGVEHGEAGIALEEVRDRRRRLDVARLRLGNRRGLRSPGLTRLLRRVRSGCPRTLCVECGCGCGDNGECDEESCRERCEAAALRAELDHVCLRTVLGGGVPIYPCAARSPARDDGDCCNASSNARLRGVAANVALRSFAGMTLAHETRFGALATRENAYHDLDVQASLFRPLCGRASGGMRSVRSRAGHRAPAAGSEYPGCGSRR